MRILGEFPLQQGLILSVADWKPSVLAAKWVLELGLESGARFDPHMGGVNISVGIGSKIK